MSQPAGFWRAPALALSSAAPAWQPAPHRLSSHFVFIVLILVGDVMVAPWLLQLKGAAVSGTVAGQFAASGWLAIFLLTPLSSQAMRELERRPRPRLLPAVPAHPALAGCGLALQRELPM